LNPPNGQLFWYGVPKADPTQIWKLSNVAIGVSAGGNLDYSPILASWSDMVAIGPYSEQYSVFAGLATWDSAAVADILQTSDDSNASITSANLALVVMSLIVATIALL